MKDVSTTNPFCNCRSWKRHYPSITDLDDHRKVHNILLSLMEEVDETKFQESLAGFIQVWQARCPLFIKYFQLNYASNERRRESLDPRIRLLSRYGSLIPHQNGNPQILPGFRVEETMEIITITLEILQSQLDIKLHSNHFFLSCVSAGVWRSSICDF